MSNATGSSVTEYMNVFGFRNRQKDAWSDNIESSSKRLKRSEVLQAEFAAYSTVRLIKTRYSSFKVCVSPISEPVDLLSSLSSLLHDLALRLGTWPDKRKKEKRLLYCWVEANGGSQRLRSFWREEKKRRNQVHPSRFQVPAQSFFHSHVSFHLPCSGCSLGA